MNSVFEQDVALYLPFVVPRWNAYHDTSILRLAVRSTKRRLDLSTQPTATADDATR